MYSEEVFSQKYCGESEIPRRCACGISVPSRGVRATTQQPNDLTVVRAVLVSVVHEQARVRRIPKQPGACALGCCWLRRERDSNSRYPFGVLTLSRRASSATRASLQYVSREIGTAKVIIFSGSASAGGSIFPRGTIKSGYGRCNRGIPRGSG